MTKTTPNLVLGSAAAAAFMSDTNKFMPRVCFEAENEIGTSDADKAKAEADAAAAAKAKADAEAAADAAADKTKNPDDKDKVSDKEAELLREVMDKKTKLKTAEAEAEALREQVKRFEGIDPDKYKEMTKATRDAEEAARIAAGDFEGVKKMMKEEHEAQIAAVKKQLEERDAVIQSSAAEIDNLTVGQAFSNSVYIGEKLVLTAAKARLVYGPHFERKDGRIVAYNKPRGEADRSVMVDGAGDPMSFEAAIEKLVERDPEKDRIIRSNLKPGTQSKPDTGTTKKTDGDVADGITGKARIALGIEELMKTK